MASPHPSPRSFKKSGKVGYGANGIEEFKLSLKASDYEPIQPMSRASGISFSSYTDSLKVFVDGVKQEQFSGEIKTKVNIKSKF